MRVGEVGPTHRPGYVQGQQVSLAGRLDGIEGCVESDLQGICDLLHRLPRQTALDAVALPVGVGRDQNG